MKRLIILGAGGYGHTVADIAEQLGYSTQFLDDSIPDYPLSSFIDFIGDGTEFIPAFGNNEFRMEWCDHITQAGGQLATLIHPTAYVSPKATISRGTVILPYATINTGVTVKQGCIINCGAIVDHGCVIEDGVHICLGAIVKAENHIPQCMKVEAGTVIENRTYPLK